MKVEITAGALLMMIGTSLSAQDKPWELPKPEGMTSEHQRNAIQARSVQQDLLPGDFGYDPTVADWNWNEGANRSIPLSNVNAADMRSLLTGRYHITSSDDQDEWLVRFYNPNGKTHFCGYSGFHQEHFEWVLDRYIAGTPFGMSGIFHWDPEVEETKRPGNDSRAWPVVVDGDRGLVFTYKWKGSHWSAESGWLQSEYAAAFAEYCPKLPRSGEVNNNQLGVEFTDLIRDASPIRGIKTDFINDPQDPLTAGMYYWLNSPEQ